MSSIFSKVRNSNASLDAEIIDGTHQGAKVELAGVAFSGNIALQQRTKERTGWAVPVTAKLYSLGANVERSNPDIPLYVCSATTQRDGDLARFDCVAPGFEPGIYDITIESNYRLTNLIRGVVIALAFAVILVGCSSSSDLDETPTATPNANIDLRLVPPAAEVVSSSSFVLTIEVVPNGNDVMGVQARLSFDPTRLQVATVSIDPESPLAFSFAAGLLTSSPPVEAFTLGSLAFEVLPVEMVTTTAVNFITEGRRRTIASIDGEDITGKVMGSTITIQPSGS